jgi:Zn finger protein HypA/HybF involved in hydrogenase expression
VQALRTAFSFARTTSPLSGAELAIEESALSAFCPRCGMAQPVRSVQEWICGQCGEVAGELASGRELDLIGLEIE